jgi:hypothetical protein
MDAAHRRAALVVDAQKRAVAVEVQLIQPQPSVAGLRPTVTSTLSAASRTSLPSAVSTASAALSPVSPLRLGAGQDLDAERIETPRHRAGQLGIVVRQDARQGLDHGHLAAELGES